jgi:hypothetical protein
MNMDERFLPPRSHTYPHTGSALGTALVLPQEKCRARWYQKSLSKKRQKISAFSVADLLAREMIQS